jgi:hypothetical protein
VRAYFVLLEVILINVGVHHNFVKHALYIIAVLFKLCKMSPGFHLRGAGTPTILTTQIVSDFPATMAKFDNTPIPSHLQEN